MTAHLYATGTRVSLNFSDGQSLPKSGTFVIEALMPPVGTSLQYRIKNEVEGFSRVVVEHQLRSFGSAPTLEPAVDAKPYSGEED